MTPNTPEGPLRLLAAPIIAAVGVAQNGFRIRLQNGSKQWFMVLKLRGVSRFNFPGGTLDASAGSIVIIKPGTPHDYGVEGGGPTKGMFAYFDAPPHWHSWLKWPEVSPGLMHLALEDRVVFRRVATCFHRATKLVTLGLPIRDNLALNAIEQVLMWCHIANPQSALVRLDARIRQAMEYLSEHLTDHVTIADLAAACHISAPHLFPLFRKQVGMTPFQFLERERINRAMNLLRLTNDPIHDIAAAVGFADPFHFSTRFKRQVGRSPRAYRREIAVSL